MDIIYFETNHRNELIYILTHMDVKNNNKAFCGFSPCPDPFLGMPTFRDFAVHFIRARFLLLIIFFLIQGIGLPLFL